MIWNPMPAQGIAEKDGDRPTMDTQKALAGAENAIESMKVWWDKMLDEAIAVSHTVSVKPSS